MVLKYIHASFMHPSPGRQASEGIACACVRWLQICWKWRKAVSAEPRGGPGFRAFLDTCQYSASGILRYERIFGPGFVSTGGLDTTKARASSFPCSQHHLHAQQGRTGVRRMLSSMLAVYHAWKFSCRCPDWDCCLNVMLTNRIWWWSQEFVGMLGLQPDERVLDVGCGIGARNATLAHDKCSNMHAQKLLRGTPGPRCLVHVSHG